MSLNANAATVVYPPAEPPVNICVLTINLHNKYLIPFQKDEVVKSPHGVGEAERERREWTESEVRVPFNFNYIRLYVDFVPLHILTTNWASNSAANVKKICMFRME